MRFSARNVAIPLLLAWTFACHRQADATASFVAALRCGMTREDVTRIAREKGYNPSDAQWLERSSKTKRSAQLALVDLTFRDGKLVAVKQSTYNPNKKAIESTTRYLCSRQE